MFSSIDQTSSTPNRPTVEFRNINAIFYVIEQQSFRPKGRRLGES